MSEELEKLLTEKLKQFQMLKNKNKEISVLTADRNVISLSKCCL